MSSWSSIEPILPIPRHLFWFSNGTVSTKIYDKRDDFDFDIVNFPFLDGDVPRRTSYGVYILDSPERLLILVTLTAHHENMPL